MQRSLAFNSEDQSCCKNFAVWVLAEVGTHLRRVRAPRIFAATMEKMAPVGNERDSPVWFSCGSDPLLSLKLIGLFLPCWHL